MFFIRAGSIMAWGAVILSAFKLTVGLWIALTLDKEQMIAASKLYLGTATSGEAIDEGLIMLAAGIIVGLLVEIAKSRKNY